MTDSNRGKQAKLDSSGIEVLQPETVSEEAERRQLAGFFEGEGSIGVGVEKNSADNGNSHKLRPRAQISHAELGGFAEAEGMLQVNVQKQQRHGPGYIANPRFCIDHVDHASIKQKLQKYYDLAGVGHLEPRRYEPKDAQRQAYYKASITGVEAVRTLLKKLYPWLGHKRPQAAIMLTEILPRMDRGDHLTKPGFVGIMRWKERLDDPKPMENEDRKYTAEYFTDLWDMDAQTTLGGVSDEQ